MGWEQLYYSFWHHPLVCWIGAALVALVVLRRLVWFHAFLMAGVLVTAADAMVSGGWSLLGGESHGAYLPVVFVFVVLGDLRYYLLVQRATAPGLVEDRWSWGGVGVWLKAFGWAVTPSLAVGLLQRLLPRAFAQGRVTFLVYELIALCIALLFALVLVPALCRRAQVSAARRRWLLGTSAFIVAQYAGWALADVVILSGGQWGFALRLAPNVMYYALFLPVVFALVPRRELEVART